MKLRPLHDRVIIKRLDNERKTASGIVLPENAAEKPDQGEVLAVGDGKIADDGKVRPLAVKVGDKVLFGKYSGQTVKVDGEELLVMREEDIMAWCSKHRGVPQVPPHHPGTASGALRCSPLPAASPSEVLAH